MATCISLKVFYHRASLVSQCKEPACQCWRSRGFSGWVEEMSWRRKWQPTPVFVPGESHGQRSLVGYSPLGRKESDMTWQLNNNYLELQQEERPQTCIILKQKVFSFGKMQFCLKRISGGEQRSKAGVYL